MNIYEKLIAIQCELKAPKSQYNSFGKYNYRNCEDILEAVKPICKKHNAVLFLTDDIVFIEGRHYVRATAILCDCENDNSKISVSANAREEESKKGMDGSQVTGASSSYARKYALNGLFDIDDTKDSDTTNHGDNDNKYNKPKNMPTSADNSKPKNLSTEEEKAVKTQDKRSKREIIKEMIDGTNLTLETVDSWVMKRFKKTDINYCSDDEFNKILEGIKKTIKDS